MTSIKSRVGLALLVVWAAAISASDRTAVYARVDRVVMEPTADAPQRVQVWGVFAMAKPSDVNLYLPPARGYLYFALAGNPQAAEKDGRTCERSPAPARYETSQPGPFPERDEFGRYRNALHDGDASLGAFMQGLRARGLAEHTLWIVFGDHGEAFGQHEGNYGHTFNLYDENVHVPMLIAAPGLVVRQVRSRRVVSLVDVAPTVLDLAGLPVPEIYQGQSMLAPGARMALFFADYSLRWVGLRDGSLKVIHALDSGRSSLFDLDADPWERVNLADRHSERVRWYVENLKGWSAAQKQRFAR